MENLNKSNIKEVTESNTKVESLENSFENDNPLANSNDLVDNKSMEAAFENDSCLVDSNDDEKNVKLGGSYSDVYVRGEGDKKEVHHMPSHDSTKLSFNDGPAIKMEKEDHRQTASCGNSREAREYRAKQKELVEQGKFKEALQMDIDDIKSKFGDKYDEAISEMQEYVDKLEMDGKLNE